MGGNALKNTFTRRFERQEYLALEKEVEEKIRDTMVWGKVSTIPAIANKPSFGDMDLLITHSGSMQAIAEKVRETFSPNEMVVNGDVISFDYKEIQVDLIRVPMISHEYAREYFSHNDKGNLVGKLAHRFGMKHGHTGLTYPVRDDKDHLIGEIMLTTDFHKTYKFLGLEPVEEFADLDEMFNWVASSPYYDPSRYMLENLNTITRTRDKKRDTYRKFLEFGEKWQGVPKVMPVDKKEHLSKVLDFFDGWNDFDEMMHSYIAQKAFRGVFNGELVSDLTGLTGRQLGAFMTHLRGIRQIQDRLMAIHLGQTRIKAIVEKEFETWVYKE